jgi:hypothetical protein
MVLAIALSRLSALVSSGPSEAGIAIAWTALDGGFSPRRFDDERRSRTR